MFKAFNFAALLFFIINEVWQTLETEHLSDDLLGRRCEQVKWIVRSSRGVRTALVHKHPSKQLCDLAMVCLSWHVRGMPQSSRTLCMPHSSRPLSRHVSEARRIPSFHLHGHLSSMQLLPGGCMASSASNTDKSQISRPIISCCSSSSPHSASDAPSQEPAGSSQLQQPSTFESRAAAFCAKITSLFPLWVIIAAGLAMTFPPMFLPITPHLTTGLALTMLGMVRLPQHAQSPYTQTHSLHLWSSVFHQ